jgi:hypothetical protein
MHTINWLADVATIRLAEGLKKRGHVITVVAARSVQSERFSTTDGGKRCIGGGINSTFDLYQIAVFNHSPNCAPVSLRECRWMRVLRRFRDGFRNVAYLSSRG